MATLPKFPLLAASALALAAGNALAAAQVEFAAGGVTLVDRDGREHALRKGMQVQVGDVVRTRDGALAHIRLADGTLASLQPRTVFSIVAVRDAETRLALSAGAMRVVAPGAARAGAAKIHVDTPAGTVEAAGSGIVQAKENGATAVFGSSGEWRIENPAASIILRPGEPAEVVAKDRPPVQGGEPPSVPPPPAAMPFTDGVLAAPIPATESLLHAGVAGQDFDAAGQPQRLVTEGGLVYARQPGSQLLESGRDAIIAWGRWIGPVSLSGADSDQYNFGATDGLHYVIGAPTAVLPKSGQATYSLLGATAPTWGALGPGSGGDRSPGTFSGSLWVDFAPAVANIGIGFLVTMPTGSYSLNGTTSTSTARFAFSPSVTGTGEACAIGCSAGVVGFFAGTTAERAGVGYRIVDQDVAGGAQTPTIQGTAAFKRN